MIVSYLKRVLGSQLRLNMVSGVLSILVSTIALAISYPFYLHFLGYEKYGLWLVLAVVLGFAQLGMLGIGSAVTKLVAEEYAMDNLKGVQSYIAMALLVLSISGTIILFCVYFFRVQIMDLFKLGAENEEIALWLLPYVGFLSVYVFLVQALNAVLSGMGRMDLANYTQSFGRIIAVVVSVTMLYLGKGVESLLVGNVIAYTVVLIATLAFIYRRAKVRIFRLENWDWQRLKRLIGFGSGVFGGMLMNMLLDPFNRLMLSRYAGVTSIPIYDIAYKTAMQIRALGDAGLRAIMPEISHAAANMSAQSHERIIDINRRASRLILAGGFPLFGILFIFAGLLLKIWLQENYVDALLPAFRVMLVASLISLLGVPAFYTHMGKGNVDKCFISILLQSFINVIIVLAYVAFAPNMIGSRVFYAVGFGMLVSTIYLNWQISRGNRDTNLKDISFNTIAK